MQTWFQSSFLQSLGFAIANSLWQAGLLWLLYALLNHVLRMSASVKYRMAVALQLLSFVWFVVTIQFYYIQYSESLKQSASTGYQGVQAVLAGDGGFTSQIIRYMVWAEQALPYISVAYLLLIILLATRWISSFRYTQSIRTEGLHKIPVDWRLFVQRVAPQLGIKKNITLFLSEKITTPLTIGFWKPVILVPLASINHLTTEQLEAVLLHELAHIKRYDYLVNIFLSIVEISLFFNPFTQLLSKSIRKERENCCDDWVLQFQYSASDYAQALLRIASLQSAPAFAMAAGGKKNELLVRVKRMIGQPENAFSYRKQLLSLLLVTGMLGCMAWFNPSASNHRRQTEKTTGKTTTVAIEPMAMKVDNPLFNPVFFLSEPLKTEMRKSIASAKEEVGVIQDVSKDFVASIPPMVAAALEKASAALEQQRISLPRQQVAGMQAAKKQMEYLLRDSLSFPLPFRKQLTDEVNRSLQHMDMSLSGAQQGLDKAAKDIRNLRLQFDKEKLAKDIRVAMNEVSRIDLGGLI
ncbi:MAG TPA: M56 family metallopeptidase, partial [Sediminibacterium sp.]